jgi:hypothetical protein
MEFSVLPALAAIAFWALMCFAFSELGLKWSMVFVVVWFGFLLASYILSENYYILATASAVLDIILVLVVFGGDITFS